MCRGPRNNDADKGEEGSTAAHDHEFISQPNGDTTDNYSALYGCVRGGGVSREPWQKKKWQRGEIGQDPRHRIPRTWQN